VVPMLTVTTEIVSVTQDTSAMLILDVPLLIHAKVYHVELIHTVPEENVYVNQDLLNLATDVSDQMPVLE